MVVIMMTMKGFTIASSNQYCSNQMEGRLGTGTKALDGQGQDIVFSNATRVINTARVVKSKY